MSTKDLKYLVGQLEELVLSRIESSPVVPINTDSYVEEKDKILDTIITMASSMKKYNKAFPNRHKENFQERQALVDSVTGT